MIREAWSLPWLIRGQDTIAIFVDRILAPILSFYLKDSLLRVIPAPPCHDSMRIGGWCSNLQLTRIDWLKTLTLKLICMEHQGKQILLLGGRLVKDQCKLILTSQKIKPFFYLVKTTFESALKFT